MRFVVLSGEDFLPMAEMCVASIRHHHPQSHIVHLTDATTEPMDVDEVWRAVKLDDLAYERVRMFSGMDATPTVVLDADTLICRPLDDVWSNEFDVALTWRPNQPAMPYNSGVIFCREPKFFASLLSRMENVPRYREFLPSQEALALEAHCGKWRVHVLKCSEWNNSDLNDECIPPARILHYKGARKKYMQGHFDNGVWQ